MIARSLGCWALAAAAVRPGCTTLARGGADGLVVASSPLHLLTMPVEKTAARVRRGPAGEAWLVPVRWVGYLFEDLSLTTISAVDMVLTPAYAPFGLGPLGVYDFERFPPVPRRENAREVEAAVLKGLLFGGVFGAWAMALHDDPGGLTQPTDPAQAVPGTR